MRSPDYSFHKENLKHHTHPTVYFLPMHWTHSNWAQCTHMVDSDPDGLDPDLGLKEFTVTYPKRQMHALLI